MTRASPATQPRQPTQPNPTQAAGERNLGLPRYPGQPEMNIQKVIRIRPSNEKVSRLPVRSWGLAWGESNPFFRLKHFEPPPPKPSLREAQPAIQTSSQAARQPTSHPIKIRWDQPPNGPPTPVSCCIPLNSKDSSKGYPHRSHARRHPAKLQRWRLGPGKHSVSRTTRRQNFYGAPVF